MLAAVLFLNIPASALSARKAAVLDPVGMQWIFEKNADDPSLIASTTKIMTGLLVCETCNVLETVQIPLEAVGVEGSSMYLQAGEKLTVQELLYGMLLRSGNDAATALAIHCGGSVQGFAAMMNEKARDLGLTRTHFENPHGLDGKNHRSTARDLAVLGMEAMKNPIFARTVSTKTVHVGNRSLKNHNKLLWRLPGAEGIKTGYTKAAGRILVSSAMRDGRRLVAVTINAPDDWNDHMALLNQGFSRLSPRTLIRKGQRVGALEVSGGRRKQVPLVAAEDFCCSATQTEQAVTILPGPGFVYAPVVRNADAGRAWVLIGGTPVGTVPVIYGTTVERQKEAEKGFRPFGG